MQKAETERALQHLNPLLVERRAELITEMLGAVFFLFDLPSLERSGSEALALAEQVNRPDLAANAIGWLGRVRSASGDLEGSLELDRAAIARVNGERTVAHAMQSLTHYLMGTALEGLPQSLQAAEMARSSPDTTFAMHALPHLGLNLASAGRYAEAADIFEEARQFGQTYGALPLLARATAMRAGLHLNMFDYEGAATLAREARELGRSVGFGPSVVSAGIDLLLIFARQRDLSPTETLLADTIASVATTPGWHEWLWRLRLCQVRAELAFARGTYADAVIEASEGIRQSQIRCRPKYRALGLITRARALHGLDRTHDAIADARAAVGVARGIGDPALLLSALDALLGIDGDDDSSAEARTLEADIARALPNETIRRRFAEAEVVRRVRHY
jgi:tetratricopeptide (TPR) repeat protein